MHDIGRRFWSVITTGGYGTPLDAGALFLVPFIVALVFVILDIIRYYMKDNEIWPFSRKK